MFTQKFELGEKKKKKKNRAQDLIIYVSLSLTSRQEIEVS